MNTVKMRGFVGSYRTIANITSSLINSFGASTIHGMTSILNEEYFYKALHIFIFCNLGLKEQNNSVFALTCGST